MGAIAGLLLLLATGVYLVVMASLFGLPAFLHGAMIAALVYRAGCLVGTLFQMVRNGAALTALALIVVIPVCFFAAGFLAFACGVNSFKAGYITAVAFMCLADVVPLVLAMGNSDAWRLHAVPAIWGSAG